MNSGAALELLRHDAVDSLDRLPLAVEEADVGVRAAGAVGNCRPT
jgi:hypothetical protein